MKKHKFRIDFSNGKSYCVSASSFYQAFILATADFIEKGLDFTIEQISCPEIGKTATIKSHVVFDYE